MPEITFYVLATDTEQARHTFACKLIEKIYRNAENCFVLTDNIEQAQVMDKQLWLFRAGSFVPHQIYIENQQFLTQTILIGYQANSTINSKIILNLSQQLPIFTENTQRILEVLDNNQDCKLAGRQRYRQYQQMGYTVLTHHIELNVTS